MNETTNIPAILRGKPQGTKLHDLVRCIDVTFHLINGDEVCLDNGVSESVIRCEYHGDKIGIPQDFKTEEYVPVVEVFRRFTRKHITIPLSSIVRVDMKKSNETNWKQVWKNLNCTEKKEREEYYQEYGRAILLYNRLNP